MQTQIKNLLSLVSTIEDRKIEKKDEIIANGKNPNPILFGELNANIKEIQLQVNFFSNRIAKYENVSLLSQQTVLVKADSIVKFYEEKVDELIKRDKGEPHQYDTKGRVLGRATLINSEIEKLLI